MSNTNSDNKLITLGGLNTYHNELIEHVNNAFSISWIELKNKRDSNGLVPGAQYRIIDYVTTTVQENTQSVNHQFDIIVTADDVNTLNENAKAIQHTNGENDYFHNSNLDAWELKYCLDNDTNRFDWADDSDSGRGVIYYMKDEWGNECPYDFKNIQFARWELSNPLGYRNDYDFDNYEDHWIRAITPYDSLKTGFYGLNGSENVIYYGYNENYECYKYRVEYTISDEPVYCYTFGKDTDYSMGGSNYGNVIKEYKNGNKIQLNNIVFLNNYCRSNSFGNNCYSNTFGEYCYENSFSNSCYSNTFGDSCKSNSFGNSCYSNTFGDSCKSNSFGNGCNYNTFVSSCSSNVFGDECLHNHFGKACSFNTFSVNCFYNTFGEYCYENSFCNHCSSNSFGSQCYYNSFGNACEYNVLGNYCDNNSFGDACDHNSFGDSCDSNSFSNSCSNNTLGYSCCYNSFGNYCCYNDFGGSCKSNSFGNRFFDNTFGSDCSSNSFSNECQWNHFGDDCYFNSFGNHCESNSFGNNCYSNTFGEYCYYNSFGEGCYFNSFGDYCYDNAFGLSVFEPASYYRYIIFDSGNSYINLNCTTTTGPTNYYQNVRIGLGVNNTSTHKTINDSNVNQTYETLYKPANSQTITV